MVAGGIEQGGNVALIARQKMPAVSCIWPPVSFEICLLLRCRQFGRVLGVEADCDDFKVLPGIERNCF
jgi:hypothetical protein